MNRAVWKFPIPVTDEFSLPLPAGAQVLTVAVQNATVCVWALVDVATDSDEHVPVEPRFFRVYGTGHNIDPARDLRYVGTFQLYDGTFIGHLFEADSPSVITTVV